MSLPLLVFDVNETLLDLDALAPHFKRMFGEGAALREWFAQLILYSEAITRRFENVCSAIRSLCARSWL